MPLRSIVRISLIYPKTIDFHRYINVYRRPKVFIKRKQCNNFCKQRANKPDLEQICTIKKSGMILYQYGILSSVENS